MIKKLITITLLAATALSLYAGSVNLAWDATTDPTVNRYKVYAVAGSNTVFTAGNANAYASGVITAPQTTASVTNLYAGYWTFVATCVTTNGLESVNSTSVTTLVNVDSVVNLRITGKTP